MRRLSSILAIGILPAVSLVIVTVALTARVLLYFPGNATFPVECALVFGAAVHRADDPGPGITRRTATAVRLLKEKKVQRLIFTGGKGSEAQQPEALVMRSLAMRLGVDPDVITVETEAASTWENLQFSRGLLQDCDSLVAVSDAYHLARIMYLAERQGWTDLSTVPSDRLPNVLFLGRSVLRELLAFFYYMIVPQ